VTAKAKFVSRGATRRWKFIATPLAAAVAFSAGAGVGVLTRASGVTVLPAQRALVASWHDGNNHFVLTVDPSTLVGPGGGAAAVTASPTKAGTGAVPSQRVVAEVTKALSAIPGVLSASYVWGDHYKVVTKLPSSALQKVPGVAAVAVNHLLVTLGMPSTDDPGSAGEYYLDNVGQSLADGAEYATPGDGPNFALAWDRSVGQGVTIADIDTGADTTNPDLSGAILPTSENFMVSPPTSDVNPIGTNGDYFHGTTVDGVIAAMPGDGFGTAGAAPGAKVLALKCSDGGSLSDSCIYSAGEYAISQGVKIINMSFGELGSFDPTLASLVADAQKAGVLVVAAAGNSSTDNDTTIECPGGLSTTYDNVISVGASDASNDMPTWSDYGHTTVDISTVTTMDWTNSTGEQTVWANGTSYASPLVASAAALIWAADPSLTYEQVKADILGSVQKVPGLAGDSVTGGVLDVPAALALVPQSVAFNFAGFDEVTPEAPASVQVLARASSATFPSGTPLGYQLQLAYDNNGTVEAVQGAQIGWSLGSASGTVTTASDGTALVVPSGLTGPNFGGSTLGLTLPALVDGSWAVVATAVTASGTTAYGRPQAVLFNVGTASSWSPSTTSLTVTTTAPVGTTVPSTAPAGGTTPGTIPVLPSPTVPVTSPTVPVTATTVPVTATTAPVTASTASTTLTTAPATATTAATTVTTARTTVTSVPATTTTAFVTTAPVKVATTTVEPTTTAPAVTATTAVATATTAVATATTAATVTVTTAAVSSGSFQLSSVSPTQLPTSGGQIDVFGSAIPVNASVMVGTVPASVVTESPSGQYVDVTAVVPAMPAGVYSVIVSDATGTASGELSNALTIGEPSATTAVAKVTTTTASPVTPLTTVPVTTVPAGGVTTLPAVTTTPARGTVTTATVPVTSPVTTAPTAPTAPATAPTTTVRNSPVTTGPGATPTTAATSSPTTTSKSTVATTATTAVAPTTAPVTTAAPVTGTTLPAGTGTITVPSDAPLAAVPTGAWSAMTAQQLIANSGGAAGSAVPGVVL
jgi:subtilisin family serine protease